ncbi:MAG: response regulator transcription factor [Caldilineales bacterium]|nr:response regulator transcription factor [Caldilineales bacterium]
MSHRILVVDDEMRMVHLVRTYLEGAGYGVLVAYDGAEAMHIFRSEQPDLVVLDLMLPEINGLDVAREMRRNGDVPIIMLTARADETDRLVGLELGADDYVVKPFSPRELVARVRAVLRRTSPVDARSTPAVEIITVGDLRLDLGKRRVTLGGRPLELTTVQLDLLAVLARQPGRVFTRMQLLDGVQGEAYAGYERTIDAHIKNLRKALGDNPRQPRYILTVRGVGYKLAETEPDDAGG